MVETIFTVTGQFTSWFDASNWSEGIPGPGDTADIAHLNVAEAGDLALFGEHVNLDISAIDANILTLASTSISNKEGVGDVHAHILQLDKMSFIDVPRDAGLRVSTDLAVNQGKIGADSVNGKVTLDTLTASVGTIENRNVIGASNGGTMLLTDVNILDRGTVQVITGGTLEIGKGASIGSNQVLDMGGEDGSTLKFDLDAGVINGRIANFALTDLIELPGLTDSALQQNQAINPTLTISGTGANGAAVTDTFHFAGDFTNKAFSIVDNADHTGTVLLVA